jgi:hypothetical protein
VGERYLDGIIVFCHFLLREEHTALGAFGNGANNFKVIHIWWLKEGSNEKGKEKPFAIAKPFEEIRIPFALLCPLRAGSARSLFVS